MDAVTSDEFFDLLIEHGSRFAWYFHLMPVGMKAAPELMPTAEQREYIYHRIREVRAKEGGKEIFVMDFQNDGELSADVSQAAETTATSIQREMLSLAYLSTTPVPISVRNHCLNV